MTEACGGFSGDANVTLNKESLKAWLAPAVSFGDKYQIPVWIDQWGLFTTAGTSDADRSHYLQDVLALFGDAQLHWAMWIWRRPLCGQDGGKPARSLDWLIACDAVCCVVLRVGACGVRGAARVSPPGAT